jgi:hypothetical protein
MRRLVTELLARSSAGGVLPREAATEIARENLERLAERGRVD